MKKKITNKIIKITFFTVLLSTFTSVFAAEKPTALDLYNQGIELQSEENWYAASQYFREVVQINPAFSDAWLRLSDCCYRLGEFDLATEYLTQAEKYNKNSSQVQNLKGMILLAQGKTQEASNIFNQILIKYPNDVDAHFGLAEIELYDGKFSGAEQQYSEALKRQASNRKALLSLALICAETGKFSVAQKYLNQAIQYYSGEGEVHYLSSIVYLMNNDIKNAEQHARIAIELKPNDEKIYELLSTILYLQKRYTEIIDISDFLISHNRNNANAWYLKGIAQYKLNLYEDAITTWNVGLSIAPQDEIMRFQLELLVRNELPLTSPVREELATFHINNAQQYETRFDRLGSTYEYQRALLLNPKNKKARLAYAEILEMNGMHEHYLSQLEFVKQNSQNLSIQLSDTIEAYSSLLSDTVAKKWNIDPFYLDKTRWNIAVFYLGDQSSFKHADSDCLTAQACADVFSGIAITSVKTHVTPVSNYSQAFKNARDNKFDYFVIVSLNEGSDDLTLKSTMYSGRTGMQISSENFYATGNNRFSIALRRFRNSVLDKLTVKGKILARNGKTVVIDLGKSENIIHDAEFKIIRKDCIKTSDNAAGIYYKDSDVLGTLVVSNASEEVSEATIISHGFYDRINVDDHVVLVKIPDINSSGIDNVPNLDERGNVILQDSNLSNDIGSQMVNEIKQAIERPAIIELLHNIL